MKAFMERRLYGKVLEFVKAENMFKDVCAVSAGVSGGGDSVAMLDLLIRLREEYGFILRAVHVNHGIRGESALRDQRLVQEICDQKGIPCAVYSYDVPALAKQRGTGLEETGRAVRQDAFRREREKLAAAAGKGRTVTAAAHNKNDLAETMLHHLARGTGLRGLSSLKPSDGELIRPVLCLERREIDEYLQERSLPYATDETNLDDEYTRNRIRHHILPVMEREINEKTVSHMAETSRLVGMAEEFISACGKELLKSVKKENGAFCFPREFFQKEKILQSYAVKEAMEMLAGKSRNLSLLHVQMVLRLENGGTGAAVSLPYDMEAVRVYDGVLLRKKIQRVDITPAAGGQWDLPVPGTVSTPWGIFSAKIFPYSGEKILEKKYTKWFDCDKIKYGLTVRTRKSGDYLVINSSGNRKKLTRCMIDDKIPGEDRERIPLVTAGNEVLWIAGGRMNTGCGITAQTQRVLQIEYQREG